jgi:hypothetical protein
VGNYKDEKKAKGSLKAPSARDIDMGSGDGSRSKHFSFTE